MAGDPGAFAELFGRHRDRLWAVALRTLHDPDDAADALQEAMISAFRRAAEFRGDAAVTTWLHRIVVNACLDQLRRRTARPTLPSDGEAALDALGHRAAGDPTSATDTALDVGAALQILPAGQRAALVLVDMFGYSVATAAEVLGVSPGTVKSRCARGRARLLPHVAHLRGSGEPAGRPGNQAAAAGVSPSPPAGGASPSPAAGHGGTSPAAGGASPSRAAASTAARASPADRASAGSQATPTDQRTIEGGGSADREEPS